MVATVTVFDAVDVQAIPDAQYVLAYIDGAYVTYAAARARFPAARILTITTNGRNRADICDVESGDATPEIAAQGVAGGLYGTVYSALSTKPDLDAALAGLPWGWWAANPTGTPHIVAGAVATQWAWGQYGQVPGNYDVSWTLDSWMNPTPSPPTPPTPGGSDVAVSPVFSFKPGQLDVVQVAGGALWHKYNQGPGWRNEQVGAGLATFVGQPEVAIVGGACWVSVEDSTGYVWTFLQTAAMNTWDNSRLS